MKQNFFWVLLGLLLILETSIFALTPVPETQEERLKAIADFEISYASTQDQDTLRKLALFLSVAASSKIADQELLKKALVFLQQAETAFPKDYELMAAHGSAITIQATHTQKTGRQMFFVKKGTRKMDRAVKKAPRNAGALLYRGINSLNLPPFLGRTHFAIKDLKMIIELVQDKSSPLFQELENDERRTALLARIYYFLGNAYMQNEEEELARQTWKQALALQNAPWSARAQTKLDA